MTTAARLLLESGDRLSEPESGLAKYREALWQALSEAAPAGTLPTWQSFFRLAPWIGADVADLLSVSPATELLGRDAATASAAVRRAAVQAIGLAERAAHARQSTAIGKQARPLALLLGGLMLAVAVFVVASRALEPVDLAKGKPWRASSSWGTCDPERGRCSGLYSRIMFHTLEDDSPWFEIDLGTPTKFSKLTVINRKDEFPERAVPLVMEISDDRTSWKQIARREEVFSTWKPSFEPVTARFLRARADRKTWLHLEAVRVHP